ncbi:TPA: hypothetical protein JZG45_000006 [Escherichia coli]|nr:hypothetical protein [Escherichia coli]
MSKFNFLHLLGSGSRARMDDDPEDKRDGEEPEEDENRRAEGDDPDNDKDENKASRAGDYPDDDSDENNAEGDDKDEKARACERARCAAIFATSYAAKNPALAAELAFNTGMSVKQARAVMKAATEVMANQKGGLAARMQHAPRPETGRDVRPAPTDAHALAQHAMALYNEATGGKKQ